MRRRNAPVLVPAVCEMLDAVLPLASGVATASKVPPIPFPPPSGQCSEPAPEGATEGGAAGSVGGAMAGQGRSLAEAPAGGVSSSASISDAGTSLGDEDPRIGGAAMTGLIVDLFACGGGASVGLEAALGRPVDIAINHSAVALAVHAANHPETRHLTADIWEVDPHVVCGRKRIYILWASPDCTHFSRAKSGVPRSKNIRSLAEVVVDWARAVRPAVIFLENVQEFMTWGPLGDDGLPLKEKAGETFRVWAGKLRLLGYDVEWRVLDASHFGAPTKRRRLFLVARCDGEPIRWPEPTHGPGLLPFRTAADCIDWSIPCPSIFERIRPLAEKTLARISEGVRRFVIESGAPFIVRDFAPVLVQTGYGERPGQSPRVLDLHEPMGTLVAGGVKQATVACFLTKHFTGVYGQRLDQPASTITAQDHHALTAVALAKFRGTADNQPKSCDPRAPLPTISAGGIHVAAVTVLLSRHGVPTNRPIVVNGETYGIADIGMRMLEPHELLRAQFGRFAADYDTSAAATKAAKVRLIGNSVCPEVAEAVVRANTQQSKRRAA